MSAPLRCLLADDDPSSRELISNYVDRHADLRLVGTCEDGIEAANILRTKPVDLILLDVEMPEMSGLELVESLSDPPAIVIVTGHEEYAVEAFDANATDYLVKPVRYARFLKAIDRVVEQAGRAAPNADPNADPSDTAPARLADTSPEHVFLKDGRRLFRVALEDIQWIEAQGDYMRIQTDSDRHLINTTMKELETKLPDAQFARIHRSHIVRIDRIQDIGEKKLIIDNRSLPIGPSYREDLIERIDIL